MASRRGLSNQERLALDFENVTATGAVVSVPCYVYGLYATLTDSTTSGKFSAGNTTATADLVKESTRIDLKIGTAGASGNVVNQFEAKFNPPLYCANGLYWAVSTGIASVSAGLLRAQ